MVESSTSSDLPTVGASSDVFCVVGGGISGLVCARELLRRCKRKCEVVVLEAAGRVGGRTLSQEVAGARIDLGGQWVARERQQPHIRALLRELGLGVHAQHYQGLRVLDLKSREAPLTYSTDIPTGLGIGGLFAAQAALTWSCLKASTAVGRTIPERVPDRLHRLDKQNAEEALNRVVGNAGQGGAHALVVAMVRGVFGVEPHELSCLHYLRYVACAGGAERLVKVRGGFQEYTIDGGAQQVSECLAKQVIELGGRIELNCRITAVHAHKHDGTLSGYVLHTADSRSFTVSRVVFAVPPYSLKDVAFEPALPTARSLLQRDCFVGCIIKSVAVYEHAFWREKGFSGEVVAEADEDEAPCFNCYDHCINQTAMLVCFINGAPARAWSKRTAEHRKQAVLKQLAKWFGQEALHPKAYVEKDWVTDEFTGGCPVGCWPPGQLAPHLSTLQAPLGRMHWAGTETADRCQGFMDGAVSAGKRAAMEALLA